MDFAASAGAGRIDMKRYTYFDGGKWRLKIGDTEYSGDWVERLAAYEETGLEPEELAQAKKKGRLVVLPCEIGSPVYSHARKLDGADYVRETEFWWSDIPQMGKTVFLTREAAEAALDAMGGENNA